MDLYGMIDTHVHFGPHCLHKANLNACEIAKEASNENMKAIVLKCNFFPSTGIAYIVQSIYKNIKVFGGIVLNYTIGGLNSFAVEHAVNHGEGVKGQFCKFICLPTFGAKRDIAWHKRSYPSIEIMKNGKVVDELKNIFEIIAKNKQILLTGHLGEDEIFPIVDEAKARGVEKIVVPHPLNPVTNISIESQIELSKKGVFLQHCFVDTTMYFKEKYGIGIGYEMLAEAIRSVGADKCIMATDLGADPGKSPSVVKGYKLFVNAMLKEGFFKQEIRKMTIENPSLLLDLV